MKHGLRFGVILLLAIAGLGFAIIARHAARADVDRTAAVSCIFFAAVLSPADACDGLDAQDVQTAANSIGDEDGALELSDLEDLDLDANQITDEGPSPWLSTIYVIAFVDNDGAVTFDAQVGVTVAINDDGSADDLAPTDDANVETCDGDDDADCGTSTLVDGDGVVVATITDATGEPGDAIDVDVEQDGAGGTETILVVGAPDEVALTLVESTVQSRETDSDCTGGDPDVTDPDALANLDSTLALAVVTDSDGTPLTRIVTTISSDDNDIADIGDSTQVTVDAGGSGIVSITVICGGDDTGTANINVDIIGGENDSETITVTGEPAAISLAASPAAIDCGGDQSSTVTAFVVDEDGNNVANGTPVTFSVVALGVADPVNALTFDGVATSSIYPVAGNTVGMSVVVSAGNASAFIRIDCDDAPPSPPPGRPRAIQLKATPERINCNGGEPAHIRVRVLDDFDRPVLDGTYVEFVTEGDGFGVFTDQQVVTGNGEANTDVWFEAYDPAFPPFAFDVRATAGMLSGSIRVYCDEPTGCVSPPVSPPGGTLSPPCEPLTPTPVPPDCQRGNSGRIISPPCNEPGRPLSPPGCTNRGGPQPNTRNCPPTIEPPASPPECIDSPPSASVSPPCAPPTPGPRPAVLSLDCDTGAAGVQRTCGPLPDGTQFTSVGIVLENLSTSPVQLANFEARVLSPDETELIPAHGSGSLDNNPDFNQTELGTAWGCDVASDEDPSVFQSLSSITCFNAGPPVYLPGSESLTLAIVGYALGPTAESQIAQLELTSGGVGGSNGAPVADCTSCSSVDIELPADIPDTTPTPTPTTVPDQPPAQAIESIDATGTPEKAYFAGIDCDLAKSGLQDACTFDIDAGILEVGFVLVANPELCGQCDLAAFNFMVNDTDRSRLDPPLGADLNLDGNPNFNEDAITGSGWQCVPPAPDNNTLPDASTAADSFLSCFKSSDPGTPWTAGTPLLAATVRYAIPDQALPGDVLLVLHDVSVGDMQGNAVIDCFLVSPGVICRPATITLVNTGGLIPISIEVTDTPTAVPTATPTPGGDGLLPLICADVTGDGAVTPEDAVAITSRVGQRNARYDITNDGKVTVKDVLASVRQLNRTC